MNIFPCTEMLTKLPHSLLSVTWYIRI